MSNLTVDNLNECRELDQTAAEELRGGFTGIFGTVIASISMTKFTQNEINANFVTGNGGINSIGSLSFMPVSAGSPMTLIQGL